jgi:hypothetical protein
MSRYAENTAVPVSRSKAEIEEILTRYGASSFASGWDSGRSVVQFQAKDRIIRFELPMPAQDDKRFARDGRGNLRTSERRYEAWEQACRQRWRCLALAVKAKLEAVESGITTFEDEFMAHIVLPGGKTLGQWARPQIADAYEHNRLPSMLPGATADGEIVR